MKVMWYHVYRGRPFVCHDVEPDPVAQRIAEFERDLDDESEREVYARRVKIERIPNRRSKSRRSYGHMFGDVQKLKYLHQRYTNYQRSLNWVGTYVHRNLRSMCGRRQRGL